MSLTQGAQDLCAQMSTMDGPSMTKRATLEQTAATTRVVTRKSSLRHTTSPGICTVLKTSLQRLEPSSTPAGTTKNRNLAQHSVSC
eukprot:COSAG02_NODE_21042_length_805_cov_1.116147_2_plen_86_part_00